MKRKQLPQESKLTSFFSKKSKAQSPSVLTEQSTDQQSTAVALETKVTKHFDSLEPFVTLTDSTPTTENAFPDVWTTDQWAQKRRIILGWTAVMENLDARYVKKWLCLSTRSKGFLLQWNGRSILCHTMVIACSQS